MCRSIKTLYNLDPPATEEEIRAACLQFVRKLSGFNKPSRVNRAVFLTAVDAIAIISRHLLESLETAAPPRSRVDAAARAQARLARRLRG
jgi:hypothetical protein